LPPLADIRDLDQMEPELGLQDEGADTDQSEDTPWMPFEPLQPLDREEAETGFYALMAELGSMESNIKTDFDDLRPADSHPDDDQDANDDGGESTGR
jgi:segregation and condensation protein B